MVIMMDQLYPSLQQPIFILKYISITVPCHLLTFNIHFFFLISQVTKETKKCSGCISSLDKDKSERKLLNSFLARVLLPPLLWHKYTAKVKFPHCLPLILHSSWVCKIKCPRCSMDVCWMNKRMSAQIRLLFPFLEAPIHSPSTHRLPLLFQ